jgi:predicted O-methyltransferase YrrM
MSWRILKYIEHLFYRKYRKGHGIHSPYLYEFVSKVVFNAQRTEVPERIVEEHLKLRSQNRFVRRASVSEKRGALLYRIARWFQPEMIVELGTGMGISTIYLASAAPEAALHSIERDMDRASKAAQLICRICPGPVSIHWGEMGEKLEDILPLVPGRYVAFVDGDHNYEPTLHYARDLLERAGDEAIIVMDDIYWSRGMYRAWKEISSWQEVRVSVDLFHLGILLLRRDLHKRQIKIKF